MVKAYIGIAVIVLTLLCMTFLVGTLGYVWLNGKDCALRVIVAADKDVMDEVMVVLREIRELQDELNHLNENSTHIIAENSGHSIHLDEPELVVDAIHDVLDFVEKELDEQGG